MLLILIIIALVFLISEVKLENIMLENNTPDASVKIIDFGLSTKFLPSKGDPMTARVGTVYTMA